MNMFQRDIVEINFLFPNGKSKPHMAIIKISYALVCNSKKNLYICLQIKQIKS
jgi:hypothetical protein